MLGGLPTIFAAGASVEELSVTLPSTAEPSRIDHKQSTVAPPFTFPPAFMVKRGEPLTPDAGVVLNEICTVSRWRAPSAVPAARLAARKDFTPDRSEGATNPHQPVESPESGQNRVDSPWVYLAGCGDAALRRVRRHELQHVCAHRGGLRQRGPNTVATPT